MDRLAAMTAFARVAETGSFSEAARRLRSSKSVVSRQVAALETDLGVRLLHRSTRALTLTEAGHGYFDQIVRILAEIDEANLSVSHLQAAPRGRLRVNAPMSFGIRHLAPAIPDFLTRCPEVEIDITLNDRFVDLVDEGFDMAVRIGHLIDSSLVARRLAPLRRIVCASPAYLAARGLPTTPDEISGHECLCYSNMSAGNEWKFTTPDGRPWPVEVKGRLRVNNGDALRVAALEGLGLACLPTFIVGEDLRAGTLVPVLAEAVHQEGGVFAVYPHARHLSPKVRAFIDYLVERFGPNPPWDRAAP
ncbi:LysR family transcriptional regulator [Magnetospirillum molischianum]|uniref:Transcriptional regulator n=1 Tax=Magnetospirillum molischianum DSM 120 TaxID=1150626 RepID=H8FP97_MAGML|nr:LysR family transcriptional regulator [Magnetospirillum molischianum]CCG40185.1 Transcriptional regulator [Magnetospirillum molischianum DSM 120]